MTRSISAVCGVVALGLSLAFMAAAPAALKDNFWNDAAQGGMAEVELGNLAAQRAQSDAVRQFAQQMVTDHTAANDELKSLAASKNVTLPTSVDSKQKASIDKLGARSGADFDRDFMKMMIKDHEKMIRLFQDEAKSGTDAEVKAWAAKTLPTLQSHLQMAQSINTSLQGAMATKGSKNSNSDRMKDNSNSGHMNMNSNRNTNSNGRSNSNRNMNSNSNVNRN